MTTGDAAWAALAAGIALYEASGHELMTDAWRRYLIIHPILARIVPLVVAFHLNGWLPWWVDPIHGIGWLGSLLKGFFRG
ncbi:DUF7427 family protein [Mycobacteroides immunogenum]|uniref:Uncharacterized protein n=1 Tax=Mycobacteroides immunogenum TaxID=83262 RepID=A0A7V8LQT0_9MYCO|nr:hypothetical protein [Mycobacteroides immunogenum]KPG13729.1 hypothetical protein AN909_05585 [Mycobacteroides immunogenum]KPG14282.1 hypothetical protein AN908_06820 [Mycobacteroides immunogenum]KPG17443.1 hypothetical protein AN910_04810 [Mycobacteroides immunogenum]KPG23973.1 hypothetical protein AN911_00350 [Mycobacteroides immunogenum]KPG39014.1 hypothetical protein AN914_09905 [Mycobacteroides immunogenum]